MQTVKLSCTVLFPTLFFLLLTQVHPISARSLSPLDPAPRHLLHEDWPVSWIAHPTADRDDYGVYHFRRNFRLENAPSRFVIHVSADNRYRLYVNGREAGEGPARGDLWHWRYESYDIAEFLHGGSNTIAAVVWNFAEHMPVAQMSNRTGFLLRGDSDTEADVNTGEEWTVLHNRAYTPIPVNPETMGAYTVVGPGDMVDGSSYPWGWQEPGFDDSRWSRAAVVSQANPRGRRWMHSHWHLVPRMIPQMEKKPVEPPLIRRSKGVSPPAGSFRNGDAVRVSTGTRAVLLLDMESLTTACPEIFVSGGRGARVQLTYAEALLDEEGVKGNRDRIEGKSISGYYDRFLPDGGDGRMFSTLWFRTFRYLELEVETADEPLVIDSLGVRFCAYPFERRAEFESGDSVLAKIWDVGWRTARLCAGETYFDCPYYEQLNYVGDTRIQALISLYVSGDDRLMRKAITQFDDSRMADGFTQSRYPSNMTQVIPPYSLFWTVMVHDYWMHRDDDEFTRSMMPGVRAVLGWFEDRLRPDGLLGRLPWWNFVDWAPEYDAGVPPGADEGTNTVVNLQFAYALQRAAELADSFGYKGEGDHYRRFAERITGSVRRLCWSPERGLFAETPFRRQFSQHANVMAVLTDMLNRDSAREIMSKVLGDDDLIQCTFYYRFYLNRALVEAGLGGQYLDNLGPWRRMLELGLTTFAEKPEPTRSDCHAWSAGPLYDFLAVVLGITPASPGFGRVRIEPHPGRLGQAEGSMPHPAGDIRVSLRRRGGNTGLTARVVLPAGVEGEFVWNGETRALSPGEQTLNFN